MTTTGGTHAFRPLCIGATMERLLAGIADHTDVGDLQMSVLRVVLLHAAVVRCIFCIFLHVVHFGIGNHAFGFNGVAYVLREIDCIVGAHFPSAPVIGGQKELAGTIALAQASSDASHFALGFGVVVDRKSV